MVWSNQQTFSLLMTPFLSKLSENHKIVDILDPWKINLWQLAERVPPPQTID